MKKVWILLADGFEETEAIGTWDALKRGGVDARFVTINDTTAVEGAHGLHFSADATLEEVSEEKTKADAVALPGGMGNAERLKASRKVAEFLRAYAEDGKYVGAMCASPMVLSNIGLLDGKKATIYPGMEGELSEKTEHHHAEAIIDGKIITARGPVYGLAFGVAILSCLAGEDKAKEVAEGLLLHEKGVERLPFL